MGWLKRLLKKVFTLPPTLPNDWEYVWDIEGIWRGDLWGTKSYCRHVIWFSPSRRQLKMEHSGEDPFGHRTYSHAKIVFAEYAKEYRNKKLIN